MNRRNLGTSSGRREKAVDKSAMERMVRQNRARRKKRRKISQSVWQRLCLRMLLRLQLLCMELVR